MITTAPGKLMLTGEYAVLDGAPAVVVAVDRRVVAHRNAGTPAGSSPFLIAVVDELARRYGPEHPATRTALEISVDSSAFYDGMTKLGLGSSAAVTVAATARALERIDRDEILAVALAAHAAAQEPRGSRGSGADVAAAVHGGTIVFTAGRDGVTIERQTWPSSVLLLPFFTGQSADTPELVARVAAARAASTAAVDAALAAISDASRAVATMLSAPADLSVTTTIAAFSLAAHATERLAAATGVDLVPACITQARAAMSQLGGTAKTTGAGGGDIGVAIIPASADVTLATRLLIEAKCRPLQLSVDATGVDTRPGAK